MPPKKNKEGSSEASAPKKPRVNCFPFNDEWLDNAPQEHRRMLGVPGSVEDERMFSAVNFIRSDRRRRLQAPHLTACACLFKDVLFTSSTFPFPEAIGIWHNAAVRGRYRALPQRKCNESCCYKMPFL